MTLSTAINRAAAGGGGVFSMGIGLAPRAGGGGGTSLVREPDGTVTITSLGPTWSPTLERQPDGTVNVIYGVMMMMAIAGGFSISSAPDMGMPFTTAPTAGIIEVTNA